MTGVLGVVLAGGRSRRFNTDKRMARLEGSSLLERALETLRRVTEEVVLSVGTVDGSGFDADVERVLDPAPDLGPLGGLLAGLAEAGRRGHSGIVVLAVDLPLVGAEDLARLLPRSKPEGVDAILARDAEGRGQPLCGWYSSELRGTLEAGIATGTRSVARFVEVIGVRWVDLEREEAPPVLLNVNRPEDLEKARQIMSGRQGRAQT